MSQGKEISGGRVNYYLAPIAHPQREEQVPYTAECEDIIDYLEMTPDEANIFKELWRTCNERTHGKGKEGNTPLRAAQKYVHYSGRNLKKAQRAAEPEKSASVPKGNGDWIEWKGGKCPVPSNTKVDVILRNDSRISTSRAKFREWDHHSCPEFAGGDIVQYRIIA
jgi:hypothetical protein